MNKYLKYGIIGAGVFWAVKAISDGNSTGSDLINQGQSQTATFPNHQYKTFADSIESSLNSYFGGFVRDDPGKVVTIIKQMKNTKDVGKLMNAFGERNFGVSDVWGLRNMKNLQQAISSEMPQSYRDQINAHMQSINVNIMFV